MNRGTKVTDEGRAPRYPVTMRGRRSGHPSQALAYLALAALGLQLLLGIAAPDIAAWSPAHTHISLDGRTHAHVHVWDASAGALAEEGVPGQSQSAPSYEGGLAAAVALPAAVVMLLIAGTFFLASLATRPIPLCLAVAPATPPPRG